VAELPGEARRALLVAAAYQGDDLTTISTACAEAGTSVALLAQAEARGLVRIGQGHLAFGHPLIRGAVYQGATAEERWQAHRVLAGALHGERRAWHLAAAAVGPDEQVAAELERAAGAAAARRGFASAAAALERAARLSPDRQAFAPPDGGRRGGSRSGRHAGPGACAPGGGVWRGGGGQSAVEGRAPARPDHDLDRGRGDRRRSPGR